MAKEIDELTTIPGAQISDDDLLVIYDVGAATAYKITKSALLAGLATIGGDHDFGTSNFTQLSVGGGADITNVLFRQDTVTPPDILSGATDVQTVTVTGAVTTDSVFLTIASALPAGMSVQAWVSSADTVSIKFFNNIGSTIASASYVARITVMSISA